MSARVTRSTVYFDPDLHKALKLKAVHSGLSISELVNNAVRESLAEDEEDLRAFEERANEPEISYEEFVQRLKKNGKL